MGTVYLAYYDSKKYKWETVQFSDEGAAWQYVDQGFCRVCRKGKWDELLVYVDTKGFLCIQPFVFTKIKHNSVPYKTTSKPISLLETTGYLTFCSNQWGCVFAYPKWVPGTKPNILVQNTHNNNTWDLYNLALSALPTPKYCEISSKEKLMVSGTYPNYMTWPGW